MGDPTFEEMAAGMTARFEQGFAAMAAVTKGVGGGAVRAFQDLEEATTAMPGLGVEAVDRAAKFRADTSLPLDHRTKAADSTLDFHRVEISKHSEYAVAAAARLEDELVRGLLPKVVKDEQRALVRGEIDKVFAGKSGAALAAAALDYVGKVSPAHDAELLGDYGLALYRGSGVDEPVKRHATLKAQAVDAYMKRSDGTERQIASRAALQVFKAANVPGAIAAYRHAALFHLNRDTAPAPGMLQVSRVTARGKTVKR